MANRIHVLEGREDRTVLLDGKTLDPRRSQKHHNHFPDGFNWGYMGSGPAQLALAVMLELYNKPDGYQLFKTRYVAILRQAEPFRVMFSDADIALMLEE